MKITASGSLVRIAGEANAAANEDQAADPVVEVNRRNDATAGWDPYEVWRTRVKAVRDNRDMPLPVDQRKR